MAGELSRIPPLVFWFYPLGAFLALLCFLVLKRRIEALVTLIFGIALTPFTHTLGYILERVFSPAPLWITGAYVGVQVIFLGYVTTYTYFPLPPFLLRRYLFLPIHSLIAAVIVTSFAHWFLQILSFFDLSVSSTFLAFLGLLVFGEGIYRSRKVRLEKITIPMGGISGRVKIVFLTDLHVGKITGKEEVEHYLKVIQEIQPDLILLGGDYLTELLPRRFWEEALSPLKELPHLAPTYAIMGNHDRFARAKLRETFSAWGIVWVEGKVEEVHLRGGSLQIGGIPFTFRRSRSRELLSLLPWKSAPSLCLIHDPLHWNPEYLPPGSLSLSGHLHGGQVGIRVKDCQVSVLTLFRLPSSGLVSRKGRRLYVSSGAGFYGFPVRIGIPNVVSVLILEPSSGSTLARDKKELEG